MGEVTFYDDVNELHDEIQIRGNLDRLGLCCRVIHLSFFHGH